MTTEDTRSRAERAIGYDFRDPTLLERALTHASIADARVRSNERMEYLGDAVLGLVACEMIYLRFPEQLEGEMTKIKSAVVSRTTCGAMAESLGLSDYLSIGKGMKQQDGLPNSLLAAALEAVVAAIYLDGGLDPAREFLVPLLEPHVERAAASGHQENYKSILQQHAQQHLDVAPLYVVLSQVGPDHAKRFEVSVELAGVRHTPGVGASKKSAEQAAARLALVALGVIAADGSSEASADVRPPVDCSGNGGVAAEPD
ncbi:MAG: ribonuclease III [Phycisphaerae bacterium]|nr:ribonuclease III [Phycisphaerae bacterium]